MEGLLKELIGKKIDVNCGSNVVYHGEVVSVSGGVLKLSMEDEHDVFLAIEKIAAVTERKDSGARPGFIV